MVSKSSDSMRASKNTMKKTAALGLLRWVSRFGVLSLMGIISVWSIYSLFHGHSHLLDDKSTTPEEVEQKLLLPFMKHKEWIERDVLKKPEELPNYVAEWNLPPAFERVVERASEKRNFCANLQSEAEFAGFDSLFEVPFGDNETVATLPSFGIIDQLEKFRDDPLGALGGSVERDNPQDWRCQLPPQTECNETMLTVIFMAYNPDRLLKTFKQINAMLTQKEWRTLVKEIVLVWNGPRAVDESQNGKDILKLAETSSLRVVYPLKMGLVNDLMNRYHPKVVQVTTKAILFYDDDGPFYSFPAVQGGFELWKRHSIVQVGAMAREVTYGKRQRNEHDQLLDGKQADDQQFVSHCTNVNDKVDYNYRYFANYDANMVLPSGSFLHSNYLCFLWHPVLEPIRDFCRKHPVHPDDVTVSMVVSQLAGRAPRVYSRRILTEDTKENKDTVHGSRKLLASVPNMEELDDVSEGIIPPSERRRKLLFGIDWDASHGMNKNKQYWADLRTEAVNTLVQYFGSINSGSIGWCEGTKYYDKKLDGRCKPAMAKIGWLPWMNTNGTPKDTCP